MSWTSSTSLLLRSWKDERYTCRSEVQIRDAPCCIWSTSSCFQRSHESVCKNCFFPSSGGMTQESTHFATHGFVILYLRSNHGFHLQHCMCKRWREANNAN